MKGFLGSTFSSPKRLLVASVVLLTLGGVGVINWHWQSSQYQKIKVLNGGVTTCFERVTQSFTALMIQDVNSSYLGQEFFTTTSECLGEVATMGSTLLTQTFKMMEAPLSKLSSDVHWFQKKMGAQRDLSNGGEGSMSVATLASKYSSLEEQKVSVEEVMQSYENQVLASQSAMELLFSLSFFGFLLTFGRYLYLSFLRNQNVSKVEKASEKLLRQDQLSVAQVEMFLDKTFPKLNLTKTSEVLHRYHTKLLEDAYSEWERDIEKTAYQEDASKQATVSTDKDLPKMNLSVATSVAIDRVQKKAFTYGILIDSTLEDEFFIHGVEEDIQQVCFNLLNYAIDKSLEHNEGRRIKMRSRSVGGSAYLKVFIDNYLFTKAEREFINHPSEDGEHAKSIDINLQLIKGILSQNKDVHFAIKNIDNHETGFKQSEVELIFRRVETDKTLTAVKKGSKSEILEMLQESERIQNISQ